jgi:hypothetical protein
MVCRVCGQGSARRACPALGQRICSVCCGTKRQREINCPVDCQHLVAAQLHPAAADRRRQEEDLRAFIPTVRDLDEAQEQLMSRLLMFLRDYRGDGLVRVTDDDVQAASAAMAVTFETAAKGLIYEERASSLPAQRLIADLKAVVAQIPQAAGAAGTTVERQLATVFRAIEQGAREARKTLPGGEVAYLQLLKRLIVPTPGEEAPAARPPGAGLVPPGGSLLVRP